MRFDPGTPTVEVRNIIAELTRKPTNQQTNDIA